LPSFFCVFYRHNGPLFTLQKQLETVFLKLTKM